MCAPGDVTLSIVVSVESHSRGATPLSGPRSCHPIPTLEDTSPRLRECQAVPVAIPLTPVLELLLHFATCLLPTCFLLASYFFPTMQLLSTVHAATEPQVTALYSTGAESLRTDVEPNTLPIPAQHHNLTLDLMSTLSALPHCSPCTTYCTALYSYRSA